MSGVSQGVILIKLDKNRFTTAMETMQEGESVSVESSDGRQISLVADKSLIGNRGTKGKKVLDSIIHIHQGRKVGQD